MGAWNRVRIGLAAESIPGLLKRLQIQARFILQEWNESPRPLSWNPKHIVSDPLWLESGEVGDQY